MENIGDMNGYSMHRFGSKVELEAEIEVMKRNIKENLGTDAVELYISSWRDPLPKKMYIHPDWKPLIQLRYPNWDRPVEVGWFEDDGQFLCVCADYETNTPFYYEFRVGAHAFDSYEQLMEEFPLRVVVPLAEKMYHTLQSEENKAIIGEYIDRLKMTAINTCRDHGYTLLNQD